MSRGYNYFEKFYGKLFDFNKIIQHYIGFHSNHESASR